MSVPPSNLAKAQHYIPQFYLKGFMDRQRNLWVLERSKTPRASRPKEEAHRPDFYTFHEGGKREEAAEHGLTYIENAVAPIIRKIAKNNAELRPEQISSLYMFVAIMFARVPAWRTAMDKMASELLRKLSLERAKDKDRFHAGYKKVFESDKTFAEEEIYTEAEEMRQLILSGDWTVEQQSVGYNLKMMFESAFTIADVLGTRGCDILLAPKPDAKSMAEESAFLTSDNPVFTVLPESGKQASIGLGFGWRGVEVFMTLNKSACLRIYDSRQQQRRVTASQSMVKQVNTVVMATASQHLYS